MVRHPSLRSCLVAFLLLGVTEAASASQSDRPKLVVVTQNHGVHEVFTDQDGEIYRAGVNVPYVHLVGACPKGRLGSIESSRKCPTDQNALFDGVIVERTIDGRCKVKESTIHSLPVAHDGQYATIAPRIEQRIWALPCDNGQTYVPNDPVTNLANGT